VRSRLPTVYVTTSSTLPDLSGLLLRCRRSLTPFMQRPILHNCPRRGTVRSRENAAEVQGYARDRRERQPTLRGFGLTIRCYSDSRVSITSSFQIVPKTAPLRTDAGGTIVAGGAQISPQIILNCARTVHALRFPP
jgi:hypothetical protein